MGRYDGAEICELIDLLILNKLSDLVEKNDTGVLRDDGLLVLRNANGGTINKKAHRKNVQIDRIPN